MTSDPADDQMAFEFEPDDYHEPVTPDAVRRILSIIVLSKRQEDNFDMCCKFLEPTEDEKQVIREGLEIEQIKRDWCGE